MTNGTYLLAVGARATTSCDLLREPLVIGPGFEARGAPHMITPYFDGCVVDTRLGRTTDHGETLRKAFGIQCLALLYK